MFECIKFKDLPPDIKFKLFHKTYDFADVLLEVEDKGGYVAGGFVRSCLSPLSATSDLDIFCYDWDSYSRVTKFLYSQPSFKQASSISMDPISYHAKTFLSFWGDFQVVSLELGAPREILKGFDFINCKCSLSLATKSIYVDKRIFDLEAHRMLGFDLPNVWNSKTSGWRLEKYFKKGYRVNITDILKLLGQPGIINFPHPIFDALMVGFNLKRLLGDLESFKSIVMTYYKDESFYNNLKEMFC